MNAIPKIDDPLVYKDRSFIESEFVEITSGVLFDVKMQYPLLKMKNAEKQCFVRKEVYNHLMEAAKNLPKGCRFRILDAWRPFSLQYELYETYSESIIRDFELEKCTDEQKRKIIRRFVSEPVKDEQVPPVHTTGGAIDLTILGPNDQELNMGSKFDEFSDRTYTAYYEKEKNEEIKENRRILFHVMTNAGFTNLPSEWWHYDYGDRFWAFYNKKPAIYRGAFTKEELLNGEGGKRA